MRRPLLALAALLCLAPATAAAQQKADTTRAVLTATPGSTAAATELLRLMDVERVMRAGTMAGFDATAEQQPGMAQLRDVMVAWMNKHMTWAEVGPEFVRVYTETFTESELRAMIAFYQTPVGRKLAERTPDLSRRGAEIGAALAKKHMPELQQMIQARVAEMQAQNQPPVARP